MYPLLAVLIFPTLTVALPNVIPSLYKVVLSVTPSTYNPNVTFELKCNVGLKPDNVDYSVLFYQNKKSIGEYDMQGKDFKLWTNRTAYILEGSHEYPIFTTTIAVDPEKN